MFSQLTRSGCVLIGVAMLTGCSATSPTAESSFAGMTPERPRLATVLDEALLDERRAEAFYAEVMESFGERRPFSRIIDAERRHQAALLALYEAYGLESPAPEPFDDLPEPTSFREACEMAAAAERINAEMYDRLLDRTPEEDVRLTLTALRDASQLRHLRAFERHSGGGMGDGRGRRMRGRDS